jgi:hypothetical protein
MARESALAEPDVVRRKSKQVIGNRDLISFVTLSERSESKGPYRAVHLWFYRGASTPRAPKNWARSAQHDSEITAHLCVTHYTR